MLYFSSIVLFCFPVIAIIFLAQLVNFVQILVSGELSDHFFCYVSADVLTVLEWIFFSVYFLYFTP